MITKHILIQLMIIIHHYPPLSFCLATPFLSLLFLLIVSSNSPPVYNLYKVSPHHSNPSHWALTHDPYLYLVSL